MRNTCLLLSAWLAFAVGVAAAQDAQPAAEQVDPIVTAVLEAQPTTPDEIVRAIRVLIDVDQRPAAKQLAADFLATQPDEATLVGLAERFGPATFTKLALDGEMAPEGRQLADAVLGAWQNDVTSPDRIATRIQQLGDPSYGVRRDAFSRLRAGGAAIVAPLLGVLADPDSTSLHADARALLAELGQDATRPLAAALATPNVPLRREVAALLAGGTDGDAIPYLVATWVTANNDSVRQSVEPGLQAALGDLPSREEAAELLLRAARDLYAQHLADPLDEPMPDVIWDWDPAVQTLVAYRADPRHVELADALTFSQAAQSLNPTNRDARRLTAAILLALGWYVPSSDPAQLTPSWQEVAAQGTPLLEGVLAEALRDGQVPTARAATYILGRTGNLALLDSEGPKPVPLIAALMHTHPDVRFDALEAILSLNPTRAFAGDSEVTPTLGYFLEGRGAPRAIVADPRAHEASRLAGYLSELGYETEIATDGYRVWELATASPDVELIVMGMALARPTTLETFDTLRRDRRTATVPLALIAEDHQFTLARRMAEVDPNTEVLSVPPSAEALEFMTRNLRALAVRELSSRQDRQRYAQRSLEWINHLAAGPRRPMYELVRLEQPLIAALYVPSLSSGAADSLATLGTPAAQKALADLASRVMQPLAKREEAAVAFRRNVRDHGILLTSGQMLAQYDRYNASEHEDVGTQEVLGSILDTLEGKYEPATTPSRSPTP